MNQTFSLTRFARLNRWFWATKSRTYLIGALALIPIIILMPSQVLSDNQMYQLGAQRNNIVYFNFLSLLVTFSIGSDVFSALFRQESAIGYLMIPASRTEKFWLGVLYCVVALSLLSVAYFGYESIVFEIANRRLPATETERYVSTLIFHYSSKNGDKDGLLLIPYFIFFSLSISLIGSFFFRRGVFIRNVGAVLIFTIGMLFMYKWIVGLLAGGQQVGTALPFFSIAVHTSKSSYENLSPPTWLIYAAYAGTLLMLWVIARVRFNEVER